MLAANSLIQINSWGDLAVAVVVVGGALWGSIWGGIRFWHHRAKKTLETLFQPQFIEITQQLATVVQEVTLNSGTSIKDGVIELRHGLKNVQSEQLKMHDQGLKLELNQENITLKLGEHLAYHQGVEAGLAIAKAPKL